ncbi:TPA: hypothetical protein CPT79_06310 [Candidatus Gastranaerophilales bacterium HUM_6]|nr:unknown [Fusobacterium sp. CAG:815]DAA89941.1 MAG TPA: hypothetical protein CPT79_06310 [Candidatus Gastranaerophilales bacterium HUM_6]DAA93702.1 MAG TPA: hypothetical protein CPT93_04475 [Candidatus Gastranaerophilales bacterium HUM_7]DAB02320.1 MAG TPA: hypothetical protein CPT84_05235 [Candidatus Gastranaerophilales bacterium HUM_12]DAB07248.1 MAG TPA: hypothetical protein CPT78_03365 [Candidatus Gastranaerophilales bacterium HUM_14]
MKISYGHKKNVQKKQKTLADVRNERARAEKAAQKAKNKPIPVGQHQESSPKTPEAVTPQQVDAEVQAQRLEAKKVRREAQKAEKEARKQNRFGGKTIFDKAKGEYVAKPASEVKAEHLAKEAKKVKGSRFNFSGLGKYAKKGGKIGLALGLAAGVVALAKWGYDKFFGSDSSQETNPDVKADVPTGDKKSPAQKPATPTPATKTPEDKKTEDKKPEDKKSEGKQKTEKPKTKSNAPVKTPVAVPPTKTEEPEETGNVKGSDKADESGKTDKTDKNPETKVEAGEVHKVKLGDNVWNIAKKHLKEQNGVKPTNAEILKHTKEIMELNGLEFEADEKLVIIKPGQELKLTA